MKIRDTVSLNQSLFLTEIKKRHQPSYLKDFDTEFLDLEWKYNYSQERTISSLYKAFLNENFQIDSDGVSKLSEICYNHFNLKWMKLYNTLSFTYNPIHNVDETEIVKEVNYYGKTVDTTSSVFNSVNAYNDMSIDGVPSDNQKSEGNEQNGGADDRDYSRHREGNIGVTTTQHLIDEERESWQWDFINQMFQDLNSVLTLSVFEADRKELI